MALWERTSMAKERKSKTGKSVLALAIECSVIRARTRANLSSSFNYCFVKKVEGQDKNTGNERVKKDKDCKILLSDYIICNFAVLRILLYTAC